jgi:hypothetical protein
MSRSLKIGREPISAKEDFALANSEEISPFAGTEKDGELVMSHPKKNPVSQDIWLDPGTLPQPTWATVVQYCAAVRS